MKDTDNEYKIGEILNIENKKYQVYGFNESEIFLEQLSNLYSNEDNKTNATNYINLKDYSVKDLNFNLKHKLNKSQIYTGNIALDFTQPIIEGSIITAKLANSKDEKKNLLISAIAKLQPDLKIIIINIQEDKKLNSINFPNVKFINLNQSEKLSRDDFNCLQNLIKEFISLGNKTLLVINDLSNFFYSFYNCLHYCRNEVILNNLRELYNLVGTYKSGSLSTIIFDSLLSQNINKNWELF